MKELAFPEVKNLSDLFESAEVRKPSGHSEKIKIWKGEDPHDPNAETYLTDYCQVRYVDGGFGSLRLKPRERVVEYIDNNMIKIAYDTIHFEIVVYDDGTALVLVKYSQIIGSRWLAMVDASAVPREPEE